MNKPASKNATDPNVLQIRKIGNSLGLILPKELLIRLRLEEGDKLQLTEQPERAIRLAPHDENREQVMKIARDIMHEYRDTFRALAK